MRRRWNQHPIAKKSAQYGKVGGPTVARRSSSIMGAGAWERGVGAIPFWDGVGQDPRARFPDIAQSRRIPARLTRIPAWLIRGAAYSCPPAASAIAPPSLVAVQTNALYNGADSSPPLSASTPALIFCLHLHPPSPRTPPASQLSSNVQPRHSVFALWPGHTPDPAITVGVWEWPASNSACPAHAANGSASKRPTVTHTHPQGPTSGCPLHGVRATARIPCASLSVPASSPCAHADQTIDGLMTPPDSPARQAGQRLAPQLTTQCPIEFDLRYPVERMRIPSAILNQPAAGPGVDRLHISVLFDAIRVDVVNMPYVTVRDVLNKLYEELSKRAQPTEIVHIAQAHPSPPADLNLHVHRRIELIGPNYLFAGLAPAGHGWTLIVKPLSART